MGGRFPSQRSRQHPDPSPPPEGNRALRAAVLILLGIDGVISALLASFFLPLYIGPVPFPLSALISGLLNAALLWVALQWTSSPRLAALPVWTWLATIAALSFPGPGDDAVFSAQWQLLVLIVVGAVPPLLLLYRRNQSR